MYNVKTAVLILKDLFQPTAYDFFPYWNMSLTIHMRKNEKYLK